MFPQQASSGLKDYRHLVIYATLAVPGTLTYAIASVYNPSPEGRESAVGSPRYQGAARLLSGSEIVRYLANAGGCAGSSGPVVSLMDRPRGLRDSSESTTALPWMGSYRLSMNPTIHWEPIRIIFAEIGLIRTFVRRPLLHV